MKDNTVMSLAKKFKESRIGKWCLSTDFVGQLLESEKLRRKIKKQQHLLSVSGMTNHFQSSMLYTYKINKLVEQFNEQKFWFESKLEYQVNPYDHLVLKKYADMVDTSDIER